LAPLNRGGLNSTHIHGTRAPVEEPSTASKADMCGAARDVRYGPIADIDTLFDHLVGARLHCRRHVEAERLGRLEVEDQFKAGGLLHWEIGRIGAFKNLVDIDGRSSPHGRRTWSIAQKRIRR
jgi:hypothetical protein